MKCDLQIADKSGHTAWVCGKPAFRFYRITYQGRVCVRCLDHYQKFEACYDESGPGRGHCRITREEYLVAEVMDS
jgi:hypothetical protein